ncbi:MAG TPA: TadE/TadG family type IV pilus assembly protein [Streptosporangiaceae bacterium]|nr:TadE/TadG family type IV pilus assembly protein [Streptosporangiaceae bacterium]
MPDTTARPDRSAGNAALELVILAPILLLLVSLVIAAGRTSLAQNSVYAAARDAARQASISRSPGEAMAEARSGALNELASQNLHCAPATVLLPGVQSQFAIPPGLPATVTVTVSCRVPLADLTLPGVPGTKVLTATFRSPLDVFRGR